jgi:hypothetical protein
VNRREREHCGLVFSVEHSLGPTRHEHVTPRFDVVDSFWYSTLDSSAAATHASEINSYLSS